MKNNSIEKTAAEGMDRQMLKSIKSYLLNPLKGGIFGFTAFFGLLSGIKYLSFLIGNRPKFNLDITDVTLALLGFVLVFLIKFQENFQEKEPAIEKKTLGDPIHKKNP